MSFLIALIQKQEKTATKASLGHPLPTIEFQGPRPAASHAGAPGSPFQFPFSSWKLNTAQEAEIYSSWPKADHQAFQGLLWVFLKFKDKHQSNSQPKSSGSPRLITLRISIYNCIASDYPQCPS